jgi:hypothetical protein
MIYYIQYFNYIFDLFHNFNFLIKQIVKINIKCDKY